MVDVTTLRLAVEGRVGRLTLARPERLNAMSPTMLRDLVVAARWFDDQPGISTVLVAAEGRAFCAGFDLDAFTRPEVGSDARAVADLGRQMADAVGSMRAVTVAAIQGPCVGGGVVLAAACDLRLAARTARFSIPEVDLGIPLAWGGVPRLVRELGPAVTRELVLTCRPFDAAEARSLRFVNRVVDDELLAAESEALVASLAGKSPLVLAVTKRQVHAAAEELVSTRHAHTDADVLVSAQHDPDSRQAGLRYLASRGRGADAAPAVTPPPAS